MDSKDEFPPSGLDPTINSDWEQEDVVALIRAAEDQDPMLRAVNRAYDQIWHILLHNEDIDQDDDHPLCKAEQWFSAWRIEHYPHIWTVTDRPSDEEEEEGE